MKHNWQLQFKFALSFYVFWISSSALGWTACLGIDSRWEKIFTLPKDRLLLLRKLQLRSLIHRAFDIKKTISECNVSVKISARFYPELIYRHSKTSPYILSHLMYTFVYKLLTSHTYEKRCFITNCVTGRTLAPEGRLRKKSYLPMTTPLQFAPPLHGGVKEECAMEG